eukprot:g4706.t1
MMMCSSSGGQSSQQQQNSAQDLLLALQRFIKDKTIHSLKKDVSDSLRGKCEQVLKKLGQIKIVKNTTTKTTPKKKKTKTPKKKETAAKAPSNAASSTPHSAEVNTKVKSTSKPKTTKTAKKETADPPAANNASSTTTSAEETTKAKSTPKKRSSKRIGSGSHSLVRRLSKMNIAGSGKDGAAKTKTKKKTATAATATPTSTPGKSSGKSSPSSSSSSPAASTSKTPKKKNATDPATPERKRANTLPLTSIEDVAYEFKPGMEVVVTHGKRADQKAHLIVEKEKGRWQLYFEDRKKLVYPINKFVPADLSKSSTKKKKKTSTKKKPLNKKVENTSKPTRTTAAVSAHTPSTKAKKMREKGDEEQDASEKNSPKKARTKSKTKTTAPPVMTKTSKQSSVSAKAAGTKTTPKKIKVKSHLFLAYRFTSRKTLPPDSVRKALSTLYERDGRFQLGEMDDAAELFEVFLKYVHADQLRQASRKDSIERVAETTLCRDFEKKADADRSAKSLLAFALRDAAKNGPAYSCPSADRADATRTLSCARGFTCSFQHVLREPYVLALNVVWPSGHCDLDIIRGAARMIPSTVRMGDMFPTSRSSSKASYVLKGLITFYGKHYTAFFRMPKSREWFLFDDARVEDVGRWRDVRSRIDRGKLQPVLVFYEMLEKGGVDMKTAARGGEKEETIDTEMDRTKVKDATTHFSGSSIPRSNATSAPSRLTRPQQPKHADKIVIKDDDGTTTVAFEVPQSA